jgi:hypothetical protein
LLTDLINEDMIKEILQEFGKGKAGAHGSDYEEFLKIYPNADTRDNALYKQKAPEYARNIIAPKIAYKRLQE